MNTTLQKPEDWTIERWKTEPRLVGLTVTEPFQDSPTALWKDVTVASALAVILWAAAAFVLG